MNAPPAPDTASNRAVMIWAALLAGLSLLLRVRWAPTRAFDVDELQHVHAAYLVHLGLVPYRDFFDHHTPWLHYALASMFAAVGGSIAALVAARGAMLVMAAMVLYLTFRLGHDVYGRYAGIFGAHLLSFTLAFVDKTAEIRPDVPATVCWLAGVWLFVEAARQASWKTFLWAGMWLGAGVMFTPNVLVGAAGVTAALSLLPIERPNDAVAGNRRAMSLAFVSGLAIPVLGTALVFQAHGALARFVELTVAMNASWPREVSALRVARRIVTENPYLVALALVGCVAAAGDLKRRAQARPGDGALVLAAGALVAGLAIHPAPYRQYFLLLLPILSIFAGNVVALALALPPIPVLLARRSGAATSAATRVRLLAPGGALLLCAAAVALLQRPDGSTFTAQVFMWPAFAAAGAAAVVSRRPVRVTLVAGILVATCMLAPLGVLRPAVTLLTACLIPLAWMVRGRLLSCAAVMSAIVAYPLSVVAAETLRGNDAQRLEIQYVLDTTSPDDIVQGGWTMTTLFRRGASYYAYVPAGLQALVPQAELDREILRAIDLAKPVLIENDAALGALPSVVDRVGERYEPTGVGPLFRRKDSASR
jgi:hypothetical protein